MSAYLENSIVIDSNVWISALVFGGNPRAVFEYAIHNGVIISASVELLSETRRIILKKFKHFKFDYEDLISAIHHRLNYVNLGSELVEVCRDPNDNFLIEIAILSRSRYLISGDQDLLSLKRYQGVIFLNPSEYLQLQGR